MKRWLWVMPLLAAAIAYAPAPWGQLVWDDPAFVDFQARNFQTLRDVFVPPQDITRWSYAYYRPVVVLSYLLDARIFGPGSPAGPHVVNAVYHLAITGFVWLLLRRLLRHRPGGEAGVLFGAMFFAVHPIHTESVSWVVGRSDLLAVLFLLPALLLALRWRDKRSLVALLAAPLLFLLALLAKEVAITGLALLPLLLVLAPRNIVITGEASIPPRIGPEAASTAASRREWIAAIAIVITFVSVTAIYLWMRQWPATPAVLEYQPLDWSERAWRAAQGAAHYIGKVLVPYSQSAVITWEMVPGRVVSVVVLLSVVVITAWAAWRWRRGDGTLLLAVGWFAATLALALWTSIGPVTNTPLAERHLYLPSVGVALGAGAGFGVAWSTGWRLLAGTLAALVLVLFTAAALNRGIVWQSDYTLWMDTTAKARTDGMAWLNLGVSQLDRGEDDEAMFAFERALADPALAPKFLARAANGIGMILAERGEAKRAEESFRRAIALQPEYVEPYYQLAVLYIARIGRTQEQGDLAERNRAADKAIGFLATATARYPDYHAARLKLAALLIEHGNAVEAEGNRAQALRRYQAARDQLDTLDKHLAADQRPGVRDKAIAQAEADPAELRRRLQVLLPQAQ